MPEKSKTALKVWQNIFLSQPDDGSTGNTFFLALKHHLKLQKKNFIRVFEGFTKLFSCISLLSYLCVQERKTFLFFLFKYFSTPFFPFCKKTLQIFINKFRFVENSEVEGRLKSGNFSFLIVFLLFFQ